MQEPLIILIKQNIGDCDLLNHVPKSIVSKHYVSFHIAISNMSRSILLLTTWNDVLLVWFWGVPLKFSKLAHIYWVHLRPLFFLKLHACFEIRYCCKKVILRYSHLISSVSLTSSINIWQLLLWTYLNNKKVKCQHCCLTSEATVL